MSKILILANHYNTLRIFRRELIKELIAAGNNVFVAIPPADIENIRILESYGCKVVITKMERRGTNPFADLLLTIRYINLLRTIKPDKVITYTIKPNIYGSLACKILKVNHYTNVTGLGSAFQSKSFTNKLVTTLYRITLNKASRVFFENNESREMFVRRNIVSTEKTTVMAGAGVNLDEFPFCDYPAYGAIKFLFIGRIMREKGVNELRAAIEQTKEAYPNVDFDFIGWYEDSLKEVVTDLEQRKLIKYHGFQPDVRPFIRESNCVILPSYHEGMSNTLLESAAMGRPLIASNIPGCKEAVIDGESGFLCNVKDSTDLYLKIKRFIDLSYTEKTEMGYASRKHMEAVFDKRGVVERTLREILNG